MDPTVHNELMEKIESIGKSAMINCHMSLCHLRFVNRLRNIFTFVR